jgi:hypothetical protein
MDFSVTNGVHLQYEGKSRMLKELYSKKEGPHSNLLDFLRNLRRF